MFFVDYFEIPIVILILINYSSLQLISQNTLWKWIVDLPAVLAQISAVAFYPVYITIWDDDDTWDDEVNM